MISLNMIDLVDEGFVVNYEVIGLNLADIGRINFED